MALIVGVGLVKILSCSLLYSYHCVVIGEHLVIGRILKLIVKLIASTFFGVLAAISAFAKSCSLFLFQVLLNMTIAEKVLVQILYRNVRIN